MLGARDNAAYEYACYVLQFPGCVYTLANRLLLTTHDFAVDDAVYGEMEGRRGVSSICCSISLAVQQSSYQ